MALNCNCAQYRDEPNGSAFANMRPQNSRMCFLRLPHILYHCGLEHRFWKRPREIQKTSELRMPGGEIWEDYLRALVGGFHRFTLVNSAPVNVVAEPIPFRLELGSRLSEHPALACGH